MKSKKNAKHKSNKVSNLGIIIRNIFISLATALGVLGIFLLTNSSLIVIPNRINARTFLGIAIILLSLMILLFVFTRMLTRKTEQNYPIRSNLTAFGVGLIYFVVVAIVEFMYGISNVSNWLIFIFVIALMTYIIFVLLWIIKTVANYLDHTLDSGKDKITIFISILSLIIACIAILK